jgi:thymidylate kinase
LVLEGIDGVGKTTLSAAVVDRLADLSVVNQNTKEATEQPVFARTSMEALARLLWPVEDTTFDHHMPPEYWLYLQATWYTLLSSFIVRPRVERGGLLLAGGWYFKFFVKLLQRRFDAHFLNSVFEHVVQPEIVVLLDADVEQIWHRGQPFRAAEMGLHQGYPELGQASFVDYQSELRDIFRDTANQRGWITLQLDPLAPTDANADIIADRLRSELQRLGQLPGVKPI